MNPATRQAIAGTCSIIRTALITIEAIIAAEESPGIAKNAVMRENQANAGDEMKYMSENEEKAMADAFGLEQDGA